VSSAPKIANLCWWTKSRNDFGRSWAESQKQNEIKPLCIGGVADHVHLLLSLPTTLSVAKAMQLIKGGSSAWAHEAFSPLRHFAWQSGYGAFTDYFDPNAWA
jgi:REP element-mobilizing transposase RayT